MKNPTKNSAKNPVKVPAKTPRQAQRSAPTVRQPAALPFMELPTVSKRPSDARPANAETALPPVGGEIRQTHLAFRHQLHRKLREKSVTSAQWAFLRVLWNEDGLNQKELASRVGVHATTAVPAITILERNGYVQRSRGESDKRNAFVFLTAEGKQLAHELVPFATEVNERSLEGISRADIAKLMELLARIQRNLGSLP